MLTIKNDIEKTIIINKSKFIGILKYIDSENNVNDYIDEIKNNYKDATHYCFSYIIDNVKRFNDDGEPGGTAGMPILNVLESNNLNHVLLVVVRYFGGIKLGAGGLVRAYSKISADCVKCSNIVSLEDGYIANIKFSYSDIKDIDNILKDITIIEKTFDLFITYKILISKNDFKKLNKYETKILDDIKIKK